MDITGIAEIAKSVDIREITEIAKILGIAEITHGKVEIMEIYGNGGNC